MTEERLNQLESKFAHQDDFLYQLNKIVVEQQKRLERLEKEMLELRKLADPEEFNALSPESKPPHY